MIEEDEGPVRKRSRLEKLVRATLGIVEVLNAMFERPRSPSGGRYRRKLGTTGAAIAFFRRP
jgi:hypothetical protein